MEGYGLTETSPVITVSSMEDGHFRVGTVGKIIDDIDLKIADTGEILVKGPNVMMGYYKDPEKTAEVIKEGYFHTGDKGEIDPDGFLKITGRTKEMFKTSGGKYIVPTLLEGELKQSRFIEQVMVIGESQKMPAAIIQPNFEFIRDWIQRKQKNIGTTNEEIVASEEVSQRIQEEVDHCNQHFGNWEQIKVFRLTKDEWSIDGGHLTPTMKMKRTVIREIYKDLYESIYKK
jgi:long-chain acyl-CoA synthetase